MSRNRPRHALLLLLGASGLLVVGALIGAVVLLSGVMTTAATKQHFRATHRILDLGLEYSVRAAADGITAPPLDDPLMRRQGFVCYRAHCETCHGAPGVAPSPAALGMMPVPNNLSDSARAQDAAWLYYVTAKGVRMTGMPAWEYRMSEQALWSTVAFLLSLPATNAARYRELTHEPPGASCEPRIDLPPADEPGEVLLLQYGCHSCHIIEGVVGPQTHAAPPLVDWPRRAYIAGVLPNNQDNLARWIMEPQAVSPQTAMPALGVPAAHARQMAKYLFAQE
jgi:mono/diheme cytochrome c family protein